MSRKDLKQNNIRKIRQKCSFINSKAREILTPIDKAHVHLQKLYVIQDIREEG